MKMQINMYMNSTSYLLGCVPLEYKNNYEKAITLLETIIEVEKYEVIRDYVEIFKLDIMYNDMIDRLYHRVISVEREDLIVFLFAIKTELVMNECGNPNPIEIAVNNGKVKSLDLLIKLGYDRDYLYGTPGQETYTALEVACRDNNYDMVLYLLKMGVNPNVVSKCDKGKSPLMYALLNDRHDIAELLIKYNANPYYVSESFACLGDICGIQKYSISKNELECFRKMNENNIKKNDYLKLIRQIINKKISNIQGTILDIAIGKYDVSVVSRIYKDGIESNYNENVFLSKLINEYSNSYKREEKNFEELYELIMLVLQNVDNENLCSGTSVFFEYSLLEYGNNEEKYIMLFDCLKEKFKLDYQRQMNEYAFMRFVFRNKNVALMEYYIDKNLIPEEFSDSQNIFHDIVLFNKKICNSDLERICRIINKLKERGVNPLQEDLNCCNPIKKASFISDGIIKKELISALTG